VGVCVIGFIHADLFGFCIHLSDESAIALNLGKFGINPLVIIDCLWLLLSL
jgi:hypothetical protein